MHAEVVKKYVYIQPSSIMMYCGVMSTLRLFLAKKLCSMAVASATTKLTP